MNYFIRYGPLETCLLWPVPLVHVPLGPSGQKSAPTARLPLSAGLLDLALHLKIKLHSYLYILAPPLPQQAARLLPAACHAPTA